MFRAYKKFLRPYGKIENLKPLDRGSSGVLNDEKKLLSVHPHILFVITANMKCSVMDS